MKLIIDIPDEAIKTTNIANDTIAYLECCTPRLLDMLRNGKPLQGYGRLIDADALRKEVSSWGMNDYEPSDFIDEIDRASSFIEAERKDKE